MYIKLAHMLYFISLLFISVTYTLCTRLAVNLPVQVEDAQAHAKHRVVKDNTGTPSKRWDSHDTTETNTASQGNDCVDP